MKSRARASFLSKTEKKTVSPGPLLMVKLFSEQKREKSRREIINMANAFSFFLGDLRQITTDSDEAKINEGMTAHFRPIPIYSVKSYQARIVTEYRS